MALTTLIFRCIYQERPTNWLWRMPFPESPAIRRIVIKAKALSAALKLAEGGAGTQDAVRALVQEALTDHSDNSSAVAHVAMSHILGRAAHIDLQTGDTAEGLGFEVVGKAWIAWATGVGTDEAKKALVELPAPQGPQPEGGALSLMAMQPWAAAVSALFHDDFDEARRMFRRATELSSQCGTETNSAVQWTYAASYFGR